MRGVRRLTALLGLLSTASGCLSMGGVQTANTLGKGNFELAAEGGSYVLETYSKANLSRDPLPVFDVAFRYGVSEHVDLGLRAGSTLLELQSKFLVTDPSWRRVAVSIAPSVAGAALKIDQVTQGYFDLAVSLLVGIKHLEANELVFGPRVNNLFLVSPDRTAANGYVLGVGGSFGYALAVGEFFKVLPEFAFSFPAFRSVSQPADFLPNGGYAGVVFQAKIGLLFGARRKPPTPVVEAPVDPP